MMSPFIAAELSDNLSLETAETNTMFTSQMTVYDEASYRELCKTKNETSKLVIIFLILLISCLFFEVTAEL